MEEPKSRFSGWTDLLPQGGMLTGHHIKEMVANGTIEIENFDESHLGPNSYDMCIGGEFVEVHPNRTVELTPYADGSRNTIEVIDPARQQFVMRSNIRPEGTLLHPGHLYLVATRDRIKTDHFIPMIYGRSSCGRMGISCYQTGNFGDIGYNGVLTLQLSVIYPTLLYPFSYLCQVAFETPHGIVDKKYDGKYQNSREIACAESDPTIYVGKNH